MNRKKTFLVAAIILASFCLRSPITGVGPLTPMISGELGLSGAAAGLLTTIPLLAFALVSLFTGTLNRRLGAGRTMLSFLIVLGLGILCRSLLGTAGLFLGTVVIGLGIGALNVMLPAVIKSEFPERVGPMTSIYTTVMSAFASLSGAVSVPIALSFGWRAALAVWILAVIAALPVWLPSLKLRLSGSEARTEEKRAPITSCAMTWHITLFMGLQSLLFYCFVAWYATILQSKGHSESAAGYYSSLMMLCGLPGSFLMPIIAAKTKRQSLWGAILGLLYALGPAASVFADTTPGLVVSMICAGFASGACIAFAMTLFGLHTRDARDAAALSGLAQGVGYLLSAVGPICTGWLYDLSGGWTLPLSILTGVGVLVAVFGWLSGRNRIING